MAGPQSLLDRIAAQRSALSRAERQVADWVLEHPRPSAELSIAAMASSAGVSEPTVVRFCRSLHLSGYREFKAKLIATLHRPENYLHHDVTRTDQPAAAAGKVFDSAISALVDLRDHTAVMPFEQAARALAASRQLVFVGFGASGHVATDAKHKFFRLGLPCSVAIDAPTVMQYAAIASAEDAFIAISHSGTWPELVSSMGVARSLGAAVITVTDPDAPLACDADYLFACPAPEDTSVYTPMSSRLCHLAVLDALQVALALEMGSGAEHRLRLSKDALLHPHEAHQVAVLP